MRLLFVLLHLFTTTFLVAQSLPPCTNLSSFASETCSEACAGCPLNGYQGSTAGFSGEGGSFCGGQLNETNSVWHGFIAGSSTITFSISSTGCTQGNGLQAAIFSDCGVELSCHPGQLGGASQPIQLSYNGFTPGESYLLLVNGYDGDACSYTVSTLLGTCDLPALSPVGQLNGPSQVCPGGVYSYSLTSNAGATAYEWQASPGTSINGSGQSNFITSEPNVEVVFTGQGTLQIKARALGYCGATTAFATKNIVSQAIPPTVLPTLFIDPSELPFTWSVDPTTTLTTSGSFQLTSTFSSYTGCDSLVRQLVLVTPKPSGIVFWDINGNNVYNAGIDFPLEGQEISTSTGIGTLTDSEGLYELPFIPQGTVITLSALPPFATQLIPQQYQYQPLSSGYYPFILKPQKGPASGRVYQDLDQNQQWSAGDLPVPNLSLITSSGKTAVTNTEGIYSFSEIAYPEEIIPQLEPDMQIVGTSSLGYTPTITTGYDFIVTQEHIYGTVFWDMNHNGSIDPSDLPASQVTIRSSSGATAISNPQGVYSFVALPPGDTLRVDLAGLSSTPTFQVIQSIQPAGGYPFLLPIENLPCDLSVDATNLTVFRPGFITKVLLTVTNQHPYPVPNVELSLQFPSNLVLSQVQPYAPLIGIDSLRWVLPLVSPFSSSTYSVWLQTPVQTPLGSTVSITASLEHPFPDTNPGNNIDLLQTAVVGAYDPNDKQVDPWFITPAELLENPGLEYTIRFQNTGNYPADSVALVDTLSTQLDWEEFRFLSSSHPCTWEIGPQGVLRFFFQAIQLPDSLSDPEGSQGFVKFWIPAKPGLQLGESISNYCDIYFDYNSAIRTNTAEMNVVLFPPGAPPSGNSAGFSLRPNPATFALFSSWLEPLPTAGSLTLYNILGIPEKSVQLEEGATSARVEVAFLPDGIYYALLEAGTLRYAKSVVVQKEGSIRRR